MMEEGSFRVALVATDHGARGATLVKKSKGTVGGACAPAIQRSWVVVPEVP